MCKRNDVKENGEGSTSKKRRKNRRKKGQKELIKYKGQKY
jgi:hypothetical protein